MEILVLPLLSYIIIDKMKEKKKQIPTLLKENEIQKYVTFMLNCSFSVRTDKEQPCEHVRIIMAIGPNGAIVELQCFILMF